MSTEKENAANRQIAAELLGKEWEAMILEDRLVSFDDFRNQYLTIQQQLEDNTGLINSYNEKVTYYESLKKQWSDVSSAYQNSVDDQYTAMILGKNWEAEILSGKIETLNNYKNDYITLQQAIAQADVDRYNIQVDAAKKAAAQINSANASIKNDVNVGGNYGSKDDTNSSTNKPNRYQVVDTRTGKPHKAGFSSANEAALWMNSQGYPNTLKYYLRVQAYANGGVIGKEGHDPSLDALARILGEDHMIAVKEGETILPASLNPTPLVRVANPQMPATNNLFMGNVQPIIPNGLKQFDVYKNLRLEPREINQTTNINFGGDINLEGVQDPNTFAKKLVSAMRNRTTQSLFRL